MNTPYQTLTPALSAAQISQFQADGFLGLNHFLDDSTLQELRNFYDRIVAREIDCGEDDRWLGGVIRQIMFPARHHSYFQENPALDAARHIAAPLLGKPVEEIAFNYDMLINKPPQTAHETPWHQDFAYTERPFAPAGTPIEGEGHALQFWIALDDVDIENGCMQFVPGLHTQPLLPHFVASGDPQLENRLLATKAIDPAHAVACPLPAGGCSVHHYGTPHYTGPNTTPNRHRRAYIFNLV